MSEHAEAEPPTIPRWTAMAAALSVPAALIGFAEVEINPWRSGLLWAMSVVALWYGLGVFTGGWSRRLRLPMALAALMLAYGLWMDTAPRASVVFGPTSALLNHGGSLAIWYQFHNNGKWDATIARGTATKAITPIDISRSDLLRAERELRNDLDGFIDAYIESDYLKLSRGQYGTSEPRPIKLSPIDIENYLSGRKDILVRVHIRYRDWWLIWRDARMCGVFSSKQREMRVACSETYEY